MENEIIIKKRFIPLAQIVLMAILTIIYTELFNKFNPEDEWNMVFTCVCTFNIIIWGNVLRKYYKEYKELKEELLMMKTLHPMYDTYAVACILGNIKWYNIESDYFKNSIVENIIHDNNIELRIFTLNDFECGDPDGIYYQLNAFSGCYNDMIPIFNFYKWPMFTYNGHLYLLSTRDISLDYYTLLGSSNSYFFYINQMPIIHLIDEGVSQGSLLESRVNFDDFTLKSVWHTNDKRTKIELAIFQNEEEL